MATRQVRERNLRAISGSRNQGGKRSSGLCAQASVSASWDHVCEVLQAEDYAFVRVMFVGSDALGQFALASTERMLLEPACVEGVDSASAGKRCDVCSVEAARAKRSSVDYPFRLGCLGVLSRCMVQPKGCDTGWLMSVCQCCFFNASSVLAHAGYSSAPSPET